MSKPTAAGLAAAVVCALGAWSSAAFGAVSTPISGWFWGDPRPQGNAINELHFAGARGYAVGNAGTILRTDDGGATWVGLRTGLTQPLRFLSVPAPDTVIAGGGCLARRSTDAGATFRRLRISASETSCRSPLAGLAFVSADLGYVVTADGNVQVTSDGGQSFAARAALPGGPPTSLHFSSATTGFATVGGASGGGGQIFQTTDGANSWTLRATHGGAFRDLTVAGGSTVYAVGEGSTVHASGDGGTSWAPAPTAGAPPGLHLFDVDCSSPSICAAVAGDRRGILRTTDGWATAQLASTNGEVVFAAAFAAPSRLVAAGFGGTTVISDDAGATFARVGGSLNTLVRRLRSGPGGTAYAPGTGGRIGVTRDGGQSWAALGVNTPAALTDVSFPDANTGYTADVNGDVKKTTNGGASWTDLVTVSPPPAAILARSATNVLLLGRGIRRSTNGESFGAVPGRIPGRLPLVDGDRAGSTLFAWGRGSLLASTTGGRTWRRLPKPGPRLTIDDVDFVTPNLGYLVDTAGRLYRTTTRGRRWTELVSLGGEGYELSFSSRSSGYVAAAVGFGAVVMRTADGGRTFAPQIVDRGGNGVQGLLATGPLTALLATSQDNEEEVRLGTALLGTTTGGQAGTPSAITLSATPRRRRGPGNVVIRGRLRPAEGGETVHVSRFDLRRGRWETRTRRAASNGSFSATWRLTRSAAFVVQWFGDDDRAGDGSPPLVVRVGRR